MWLIWVLILVLRFAGGGREATALLDPCRKYSCEAVSTKLMTHQEFKHFDLREKKRNPSWKKGASNSKWRTEKWAGNDLSWTRILKSKKFGDLSKYRNSTKSVQERRGSSNLSNLERKEISKRRLSRSLHRIKRMTRKHARTVLKLDTAVKRRKTKGCNKYAIFKVFGSDFQLCLVLGLFLDDSILRSDLRVSIYGNGSEYRTRKLSSMYLQLAEGHLIGQEFSSVRGYVWRDKFYGTVRTNSFILQVEPIARSGPVITRYSTLSNRMLNAYVYRVFLKTLKPNSSSWKPSESNSTNSKFFSNSRNRSLSSAYTLNLETRLLKKKRWFDWSARNSRSVRSNPEVASNSTTRTCGLLLIADHTFHNEVGEGNVKQTVLQMLYHVRESNIILRKLDTMGGGSSGQIGLHVAGLGILTSEHYQDNLLRGPFSTPEEYLRAFSRYQFDGYCLAVLFSNRVLGNHVLGLSWQGNHIRGSGAGVCQKRRFVETGKGEKEQYNLNSLFITLRTEKTERIPLRMGVLNLAHEILHSFGAYHDNSSCTPQNIRLSGGYLMSKYSGTGLFNNNELISSCTQQSLTDSLSNPDQTHCLEHVNTGYCGDGRVDEGEECDCGGVANCLKERSCCTPPGLRRGEEECRWRRRITECRNKTELSETELFSTQHKPYSKLTSRRGFRRKQNKFSRSLNKPEKRRRKYMINLNSMNEQQSDSMRKVCSILGLQGCSCIGSCSSCCMDQSGNCVKVSDLIYKFFRRVQRKISSCPYSVLQCVSFQYINQYQEQKTQFQDTWFNPTPGDKDSKPWIEVLRGFSGLAPDKTGTVICLKTGADSSCWQIKLDCK